MDITDVGTLIHAWTDLIKSGRRQAPTTHRLPARWPRRRLRVASGGWGSRSEPQAAVYVSLQAQVDGQGFLGVIVCVIGLAVVVATIRSWSSTDVKPSPTRLFQLSIAAPLAALLIALGAGMLPPRQETSSDFAVWYAHVRPSLLDGFGLVLVVWGLAQVRTGVQSLGGAARLGLTRHWGGLGGGDAGWEVSGKMAQVAARLVIGLALAGFGASVILRTDEPTTASAASNPKPPAASSPKSRTASDPKPTASSDPKPATGSGTS